MFPRNRTPLPRITFGIALAVWTSTAFALHRNIPGVTKLSRGAAVSHPAVHSWGYFLPFSSTDDLTNAGVTGRQIYLSNLFDIACQTGTPVPPGCPTPRRPGTRLISSGSGKPDNPVANQTGTLMAFDADGKYGGGTGPGVGKRQIFSQDTTTGAITRITDRSDGDSTRPAMSVNGGTMAFQSTAPLLGGSAGVSRLFFYDGFSQSLTLITNGPAFNPVIARSGSVVAFESSYDLLGDGHNTGITQIFWWDRGTGFVHQLTRGNGSSRHALVTSSVKWKPEPGVARLRRGTGVFIVFDSVATDLPGTNGGPGTQIYVGRTADGDLPPIQQLTPISHPDCHPSVPGNFSAPVLDERGRRLAFIGSGDLLCNGSSGNLAFVADISKYPHPLTQITGRGDVQGPVGFSLGNFFLALSTTDDMQGSGVCGHQLHVVNYYKGRWMSATQAGQSPIEPTPGDPLASCDDGKACTTDTCDPSVGCKHTPIPNCP